MKIKRNNQEIELTSEELLEAYQEQQFLFAKEKVLSNLPKYTTDQEYGLLSSSNAYLDTATTFLIEYQNNGMSYGDAIVKAICSTKEEVLSQMIKKEDVFLLASLQKIGVYTFADIGLSQVRNLVYQEDTPYTIKEFLSHYSEKEIEVYDYCGQVTDQALSIIKEKIIPALEKIQENYLPSLNPEDLLVFLDVEQTQTISR